jgi:hypothetical protein
MKKYELTRYYDRLKMWERIGLLAEANTRGDESEARALFNSSPRRSCELPEHLLPAVALSALTFLYIGEQLEAAAHYFFALWCYENSQDPHRDEWLEAAQADADFFRANAQIWRRFCSERGLSPETLTAANHRGMFLRYCEEHMPAQATAAETRQAWPPAAGYRPPQITAEDMLERWQRILHAMNPPAL